MALIKIKRGLKANIPNLAVGEPGYCTDTNELFVGSEGENKLVGEGTFLKLSGGTLTGTLSLPLAAPTQAAHAANKAYVDNVASGLDVKASVKCVATVNQPLVEVGDPYNYEYTNNSPVTIDGYAVKMGDRILLVGQSNYKQNGIFVVGRVGDGSTPCVLKRPADATDETLTGGAFVFVEQGATYGDTGWVCTTDDDPLVIGETLIEFTQFTGAGSSSFVALSDTPSSYNLQGGKSVRVNSGESGLEFFDPTFLNLDDTPTTFSGSGGYLVRVKENGTGLEFIQPETVGRTKFTELDDTPATYTPNRVPAVNNAGDELEWVTKESLGIQKIQNFVDFAGVYLNNGGKMLRVRANESSLEYFSPDLTPSAQNGDIPIASSWAAGHESASSSVHGAPSGVALLHQNSVIDGGTF